MNVDTAPDRIWVARGLGVGAPCSVTEYQTKAPEYLNRKWLVKEIEKEADACLSMLSHNAYSRVLAIIKGNDHG